MAEQTRISADRLDSRLEFEMLLADLSSRFVNLPPAEVDGEIDNALRRLSELLGIDFAVLWQRAGADLELFAPTHVYYSDPGLKVSDALKQELFPWVAGEVVAGRTVVLPTERAFPAEAAVDRENALLFGIKSNLTLPLSLGGEIPVGALALNTVRAERDWPEAFVWRLHLVAQVFTNALARKRADVALRASEARLASGADLAGLAFYDVDVDNGAMYVDDRLRALTGVPPERERGLGVMEFWTEHLHPDDLPRILDLRARLEDGRLERLSFDYRYRHPTRGEIWIQHLAGVGTRDAAGRGIRRFGVLRDVTEQKQAEEALRGLSRRLIQAHEDERALLARELHDDLTQRLAVLAIDVGTAELAFPDGAQADAMRVIREGLIRLSEDVHALAYQLHPSVLEELGLEEALRTECERLGRQSRIDLSVRIEPLPQIVGKGEALCLFRVAQEALTNVVRHSRARSAAVALRPLDGGLLLGVRDDGVGFDPKVRAAGRSLGLVSMRERVQLVNGTLDVESAPGQGTAIVAWVPVAEEAR